MSAADQSPAPSRAGEHSGGNRAAALVRGEGERVEPDISISTLWQWVCWSCADPDDPGVPGAYGDGDTYGVVAQAVAEHKRRAHGVLR